MQRLISTTRTASRILSESLSKSRNIILLLPGTPNSNSNSFHSSTLIYESYRKRQARAVKKRNLERKVAIASERTRTTPHPALGHPEQDDSLWIKSDLARILVGSVDLEPLGLPSGSVWTQSSIYSELSPSSSSSSSSADPPPPTTTTTTTSSSTSTDNVDTNPKDLDLDLDLDQPQRIQLPNAFAFGIGPAEQKLLFQDLPLISVQKETDYDVSTDALSPPSKSKPKSSSKVLSSSSSSSIRARLPAILDQSRNNSELLARITSLSNANAKGIAFENRRRIVMEFSEPGKPNDTGRSEVQAALLTWKIRNLWGHLTRANHDIHNRRSLLLLLHQRAKVLKYLRRTDRERYLKTLDRIGVHARAVEGEVILR